MLNGKQKEWNHFYTCSKWFHGQADQWTLLFGPEPDFREQPLYIPSFWGVILQKEHYNKPPSSNFLHKIYIMMMKTSICFQTCLVIQNKKNILNKKGLLSLNIRMKLTFLPHERAIVSDECSIHIRSCNQKASRLKMA